MNMDGSASKHSKPSKAGGNTTRAGLVKTAVNMYGNRIADVNGPLLREEFFAKSSSKAKELHRARRDIVLYKESKQAADAAKTEAETELSNAKRTVKDLFSMIGESSHRAKGQLRNMASLKMYRKKPSKNDGDNEHSRVMRELDHAKRELYQLKLEVASVLEEKLRAEKEIEASRSNVLSCSRVAEKLMMEIEAANEEQVVVELARVDALKELRDIEALENARNKLKETIKEIDNSEELEKKLASAMTEIDVLKLKLVNKRVESDDNSMEHTKGETGDVGVLETIKEEIEAAKKDLASIRAQGFKFMASMDVTRNELNQVNAEVVHLRNTESKKVTKVRNFSYKLLRAKSKLEAVTAAEEKAKSVVMNLSQTLDELRSGREAAKKEEEVIKEEVAATKEDIKKAMLEINEGEEMLQGAMEELERVKSSEALALENLKILTENTMTERSLTNASTSILISKFEYDYLSNHAAEAKQIADKKVEAAKAWVEAVKANEKEIVMKTKIAERKLELYDPKRVNNIEEFENWSKKREKYPSRELQRAMSRKSKKSEGSTTPSRVHKLQKGASPGSRPLSPFIVKKKKKVITNWTKIFRGNKDKH